MSELEEFVSSDGTGQFVLTSLSRGDKKVSELAGELGCSLSNVSRTLGDLRERGLARCVTPGERTRVYRVTEEGRRVLEQMEEKTVQVEIQECKNKIADMLEGAKVTCTRDRKIHGKRFAGRPNFVIEDTGEARVVVEVKGISKRSTLPSVKRTAFTHNDFKRGPKEIESVLVVVGTDRKNELGKEILKLEDPDFFDKVFFEEELDDGFLGYLKRGGESEE